jgi:thiamine-phosphate pyrophosphorylase
MTHFRGLKGLYLVISLILPFEQLLLATERALDGGVDILQLSASKETEEINALASALVGLAKKYDVPFLVNNNLELAAKVKADGVHFDTFDVSPKEARQVTGKECIVGYTVNVDLEKIKWAEQEDADYVSFCSIFHQCPGGICPIVPFDEVKNAKTKANIPVFAAGGINLENVFDVLDAGVDGVVVTSAILKSKDPKQTAKSFKQIINRFLEK